MNNDLAITALIRSLESQRYLAMQRGDLETFYRLAHPELIYVHSNGVKDDLASYLNKCRNGLYRYDRIDHAVHHVFACGDTALAFGHLSADIVSHGVAKTLNNQTLSAWQMTAGQWLLIAYQPTPITQPATTPLTSSPGDLPHVNAAIHL